MDATACTDTEWAEVYKIRAGLRCRDCDAGMHAKVSRNGLPFFAHDTRPKGCASEGESPEHLELKRTLAEAIRRAGAEAIIEAAPLPADHGGWRADVLAVTASGVRVAFEVQLAGMTVAEGQERSAKYWQDKIATVWISTKHAYWMSRLSSARIVPNSEPREIDRGFAALHVDPRGKTKWTPRQLPLDEAVRALLHGEIQAVEVPDYHDPAAPRGARIPRARLLVTVADEALRIRESKEDRRLQRVLVGLMHDAKLQTVQDARPSPRHQGRWQADVLATTDSGAHIAFVTSGAGISADEARRRTAEFAKDSITAVWLSTNDEAWMHAVPSVRLALGTSRLEADLGFASLTIRAGVPTWVPQPGYFDVALKALLTGEIVPVDVNYFHAPGAIEPHIRNARLLVDAADHADFLKARVARASMLERQSRVVDAALRDTAAAGISHKFIALGIPARQWSGQWPIPDQEANGDASTAYGAVIWRHFPDRPSTILAIICPDTTALTKEMGIEWREAGTRLYVETAGESIRVAVKLRWSKTDLVVTNPAS